MLIVKSQVYRIVAGCGHYFLVGLVIGWTSPTIPKLLDPTQNPFDHIITEYELALINFLTFSHFFALALSGPIANRFGRKPMLVVAAFVKIITWLVTAFNRDLHILYLMKFVESQAIGLSYSIALVYISEVVPVKIRGLALTCLGVSQNLGVLVMYSVGPFVSYTAVAIIASACSTVVFTLLLFIPESPMYYLLKGDKKNARETLKIIKGQTNDVERDLAEFEVMLTTDEEYKPRSNLQQLRELFCVRKNLKVFFICLIVLNLPEFSGMMACLVNMTDIFQNSGSSIPPHIASIIVGAVQLLPSLVSSMLVERVGRRKLMLTSLTATCVINLLMGTIFYLEHIDSNILEYITWLPLANMILFIMFYYIGLGTVPCSLLGELLPPRVKSVGTCAISALTSLSLTGTVSLFRLVNAALGDYTTFWMFAASNVLGALFVRALVPETRGRTFAQIQRAFD